MKVSWIAMLASLVCLASVSAPSEEVRGIQQLYRLDTLPRFKDSISIGAVTSYDRTGGNDDGFSGKYSYVRKDPEGLVLADLKGPGIIYRLWTPTPSDDVLEFLFDGEETPRIQTGFRDLFLGKHPDFPAPLVGFGAGGYYSYVPIPFAKSCVVRMRAPRVQFYQINYALYAPEAEIKTYTPTPGPNVAAQIAKARELFLRTGSDVSDFALPPGASPHLARERVTLQPGGSATLFRSDKGGRILGIRLTPAEAMAGKARDLLLKISFDGDRPAVLCPLGDFFGYAWGKPATQSLLLGTTGTTNYCYFPMPFAESAHLEIISERKTAVTLESEVVHADVPRAANEGTFYALWRRENPTRVGQPYTLLETAGRGHLVGVILQAQGLESGKTLFFEGDDQTYIDGELVVHGTGSEDFFNGGWYDVPDRWEKQISFPLSGCLGYSKHVGRTGAYRLFLGDAYPFRHKILQTIEHGGENNSIPTDYCSVTFFYSDRCSSIPTSAALIKDRAVQDPTVIIFPTSWQTPIYAWSFDRASLTRKKEQLEGEEIRYLSLRGEGTDWFGPHFISFTCDIPESGTHEIFIEALKGPAQAQVQLFQNENPVAEAVDLYAPEPAKSGRVSLGHLELAEGKNNLMFKLVGKNDNSSGLGLDILQIVCVRKP